jgi:transcriptional regulator with XRE-family HTH domain
VNASEIKALLESKGLTQVEVAARIGVSPQAVHQIITGKTRSNTARFAFATAIGEDPETIWPRDEKPAPKKKGAA